MPRIRPVLILVAAAVAMAVGLFALHSRASLSSETAPTRFVQAPGTITGLEFSPNGRLLMTTEGETNQPLITFRDAATGSVVHQWPGGRGEQWLSDDGKQVIETEPSEKGPTLCALHDAASGQVLRQWSGQILDVRPDFTLMVTADDAQELPAPSGTPPGRRQYVLPKTGRIVGIATGRIMGRFPMPDFSYGRVRLSRHAPFLNLPGEDQPSQLLRLPEMTPVLPSLPPLRSLRVSRDGKRAFGVTDTGTLHVWRLPSGPHTSVATGLYRADWASELPSGDLLVQGDEGSNQNPHSMVQVRSSDGARLLRALPGYTEAFSPDGRLIAFGEGNRASGDGFAVWNCETGQQVARLNASTDALGQTVSRYFPGNGHLAIAPDGRHFALSTSDGLLRLYDLTAPAPPAAPPVSTDTGRVILSFGGNGYEPSLFDAVVLPDGAVAASGDQNLTHDDRCVQIWRPGGSVQTIRAVVGNGNVDRLGISPDGKTLAGSSQWGVWRLDLASLRRKETPITVASDGTKYFAPQQAGRPVWLDGPGQTFTVISPSDYGEGPVLLTQWDTAGRKISEKTIVPQKQAVGGREFDMAGAEPSPDGSRLAVLWNGLDHSVLDGKPIATVSPDGMLELRDTRSGRLLRTLASARVDGTSPRNGAMDRPVFSPDGTRLAAADDKGVVQVWDTGTGRKLGQVSGTLVLNNSTRVAFANPAGGRGPRFALAPDNQGLAVARDDGSVYLYSLQTWLPAAQIGRTEVRVINGYPQPNQPLHWLDFSPDGRTLYGFAQNQADVLAWDVPKVSP